MSLNVYTLLFLLLTISAQAQDQTQLLLKQLKDLCSTYSYEMQLTMFENHFDTLEIDRLKMIVAKNEGMEYSNLNGVIYVKNENKLLFLEPEDLLMVVSDIDSNTYVSQGLETYLELDDVAQLEEMRVANSKGLRLHFNFNAESKVHKVEYIFDSNHILKTTVYLRESYPYTNEKGEVKLATPRMEILLKPIELDEKKMAFNYYFKPKNPGAAPKVTSRYYNYHFINNSIK